MIKKINKIKDFGIYNDFTWSQLDEFKKKNLIYGWNYSGKTTLSKLFENLEFGDCNRHFGGSQFNIEFENSENRKSIDHNSVHECPNNFKTFNSEYIKRIFTWDSPETGIEPISFYLGDPAGNLVSEIEELELRNERLSKVKEFRYERITSEFTTFSKSNGKFSAQAKEIRLDYLPRLLQPHEFNKGHFEIIINRVKENPNDFILDDEEKNKTKDEALAQKEHDPISELGILNESLVSIEKRVRSVLMDSAPKSIEFKELDSNPNLFNWVQDGLPLNNAGEKCKFCLNTISESRISDLNSFYSTKLTEIQTEIAETRKLISSEREKLNIQFDNELKVCELYRTEYNLSLSVYETQKTKYINQLDILENDLDQKKLSLFSSIASTSIETINTQAQLNDINAVISKHNKWVEEFTERKERATRKILDHYVSEFAKEHGYYSKEFENSTAKEAISNINIRTEANKTEIQQKIALLSDTVKGAEKLNSSLQLLLNRNDIKIEIENEVFTLKRNQYPATNLSEGEKSAIAFSYFLTELESLKEDNSLPNTIIFIDDPISSLDSNHIFQVRSLIQNFFKANEFAQLFISTHSFEFLSVLLDTKMFGRITSSTGESKRPLYFIQRTNDNCATIKKMPKAFSSYKSEYVGLFKIIHEYKISTDKENFPHLLIMPNAVRRFLELYTLMRYPTEKEVDNRVKEVFDSSDQTYHSTKLLHWFSHQNKFEMVQNHDDKLLQITEAIDELFNYIENEDELHWKGLTEQA